MSDWPIDWRAVVDEAVRRRKDEGLTQRSLAALAGVSVPTVNAFEQGEINLRFERIVAILDALSMFVQPGRADSLQWFIHQARARWKALVADVPEDHPSTLPHGYTEQAYAIAGVQKPPTLTRLRDILSRAPRTSGWPPFWVPTKESIRPVVRGGLLECWLGKPTEDRVFNDAAHSDFWQVDRECNAYLLRGYQEDGSDFEQGTIFDLTLPIWRNSEVLLNAAWLTGELGLGRDTNIRYIARYSGLAGRELFAWAKPLLRVGLNDRHRARTDAIDLAITATVDDIHERLESVVEELLRPLYERFEGYEPPAQLFAGQIADLRRNMDQ